MEGTLQKKALIPWNKGKKGLQVAWNKGLKGYNAGYPRNNKWREKISIANKGQKRPNMTGEKNPFFGKKHSKESLYKMRINACNWKGGVSGENEIARKSTEYKLWRSAVFERDKYTCQFCGKKGGKLQADHIKPFSTHRHLRFEISNGRTLCEECHKKTDTYGVRKNKFKGKRALILGVTGMDGSYLAEFLLDQGYEVHAMLRRTSTFNRQRVDHLRGKIHYHYGDITDVFSILWMLKKSRPHEIYNLCAQSQVQISWELPWLTAQTDAIGVLNVLESVRVLGMEKRVRIYQASTSELFSGLEGKKQNELTEKNPVSPYGTAKLFGFQIAKNYRDAYGMHISNGILFNHESFRRGDNFVTKKICLDSEKGETHLGNLQASRDWGWSPQYVEGMWMMLQQDAPDDYVLATGETHTVKEFVEWVEEITGKSIKIIHDKEYERPTDVPVLCGDASKAKKILGWEATIKGKEIAKKVLINDIKTL